MAYAAPYPVYGGMADDQCQMLELGPHQFNGLVNSIGFDAYGTPGSAYGAAGYPTPASGNYPAPYSGYPQSPNAYPNVQDNSYQPPQQQPYGSFPSTPSSSGPPYPIYTSGSSYPTDVHQHPMPNYGDYPPSSNSGYPATSTGYPPAPSGNAYSHSGYPQQAPTTSYAGSGYPPAPSGNLYGGAGYPMSPSTGSYPPISPANAYPPVPSGMHYPAMSSGNSYPPISSANAYPPAPSGGSYPQMYGGSSGNGQQLPSQPYSDPNLQRRDYEEHQGKKGSIGGMISGFIGDVTRKFDDGGAGGLVDKFGGLLRNNSGKKSGIMGNVAGVIGGFLPDMYPGDKSHKTGSGGSFKLGKILSGVIGGGGIKSGGANTPKTKLKGGLVEAFGMLIGVGGHKFLGIDPRSGHIIGSVAGNALFGTGGQDNRLGDMGKVILDNIVTGKFKRKVDPYVPPRPEPPLSAAQRPVPAPRGDQYQEFYRLRDDCLRRRILFEDTLFPASDRSLFFTKSAPRHIEWLRPGQLCGSPQLFVEGHSRFDVIQGELGDCWLLAAVSNLTLRDELFYRVVPPDQSFTENYCGIFHFQFWQYGSWVDVVIDDRLPTSGGKLLYMHSASNNEFWSALLEKAYAKLYGCYEALKGGSTSEALEDFTGGLIEFVDLKEPPENLLQMMFKAFELGSLMGCSLEADPNVWEARLSNGLVRGHAYSITGMKMVNVGGYAGQQPLFRIRNPWGNEAEWNGAWSDHSREWQLLSEHERRSMGLVFAKDGEFWMSFDDFMRYFEKLEICNLGPEILNEVQKMTGAPVPVANELWRTAVHDGAWIRHQTAGGCRNFINSFALNPQVMITLEDADPYDDDMLCTCVFSVMQKHRRGLRQYNVEMLPIGFAIYKVDDTRFKVTKEFFAANKACARSPVFINLRSVSGHFRLPPGKYCMVPSTFEPNEEGEFMIRIFTNGLIHSMVF